MERDDIINEIAYELRVPRHQAEEILRIVCEYLAEHFRQMFCAAKRGAE